MEEDEEKPNYILTAHELRFVELYMFDPELQGKPSACFKAVFPERSAEMKSGSISIAAARMKRLPQVQWMMMEIQKASMDTLVCKKEDHIGELVRIRTEAMEKGQFNTALNAEIARGKVSGHYIERKEVTHKYGDDLQVLIELSKTEKPLALRYAEDLGLLKELHEAIDVEFEMVEDKRNVPND